MELVFAFLWIFAGCGYISYKYIKEKLAPAIKNGSASASKKEVVGVVSLLWLFFSPPFIGNIVFDSVFNMPQWIGDVIIFIFVVYAIADYIFLIYCLIPSDDISPEQRRYIDFSNSYKPSDEEAARLAIDNRLGAGQLRDNQTTDNIFRIYLQSSLRVHDGHYSCDDPRVSITEENKHI